MTNDQGFNNQMHLDLGRLIIGYYLVIVSCILVIYKVDCL